MQSVFSFEKLEKKFSNAIAKAAPLVSSTAVQQCKTAEVIRERLD